MKNSRVFDPVVEVEGVDEVEVEGLASSGTLNFPLSNPSADNTMRTTMAIKINPIKHIRNLSV